MSRAWYYASKGIIRDNIVGKRTRRERWVYRVQNAATPVFLLDAKRRICVFNSGCESLTGWSADDVLGSVCAYASEPESHGIESLTASFCPPPSVFAGETAAVPAYVPKRDGKSSPLLIHFFPLIDADGQVVSVLGVVGSLPGPSRPVPVSPAQTLHAELAALRIFLRERYGLHTLIGRGVAMQRVFAQVRLARDSDANLLFQGEVGTGKEHLARLIHQESAFRSRSFVPLDCQAARSLELRQTLRRLFKTDPTDERRTTPIMGVEAGTVYLAHIEHLPRDLQEFLLKALTEESHPERRHWRLMAASTTNLRASVADDQFLEDLLQTISPLEIELPALRHRRDDLELFAQAFLEHHNRDAEHQVEGIAEEVMLRFREYHWPGNLDELAAVVAEAHANCSGTLIQEANLPFRFQAGLEAQSVGPKLQSPPMPLENLLEQVEREHIESVLEQCRFNKTKAAEILAIPRPRLYRRMESLGIEDHGVKSDD